jgi:dipeptidyl aminopeptidase/acylaminoacyl peptidase
LKRVVREDDHVQRWHADWNGDVRLGEADLNGTYQLYLREGSRLTAVKTYVSALESEVRFAAYTTDPDVIYAWGPVQGRQALLTLKLSTGEADGVFAHPEVDVDGPLIFDDAHHLVAVGYVDDVQRSQVLNENLAHEREAIERALPGLVIEPVSESADHRLVVVRASSDVRPPRYFLFDRTKRELSQEFSEYPALEDAELAPMERVTIWARDGLALPAYLTRPLGKKGKVPTVVLVHDGPAQRAMRRFDPLVQWLARRGYAVLEPNYRGSSGYGTKFRSLGFGQWNGAMQDDLEDAAAWLVNEGIADPERLAIFGRGYGGYAALMAVTRNPTRFQAAASYGAPTDLVALLEDDEQDRVESDWSQSVLGLRPRDDARLREASPVVAAPKFAKPVLLMHAEHDEHVRYEQAKGLAEALQKAGKAVELVTFPDELYEPGDEANRVLLFQKLTGFLDAHLGAPAEKKPAPPAEATLG